MYKAHILALGAAAALFLGVSAPAHALLPFQKEVLSQEAERLKTRADRPVLPLKGVIKPGEKSAETPDIRKALAAIGYETAAVDGEDVFDEVIADATERFQQDAGIKSDGVLGPETREAINGYENIRLSLIAQALASPDWPVHGRAVIVNIPAATVTAIDEGRIDFESNAVVGSPAHQTPLLRDVATSVTINPSWTVPPGIAERKYGGRSFTMKPGPTNPLGKIRVNLTNPLMIYLHGTNEPKLFNAARRALSSGCVRVSDIAGLARWLIGEGEWDGENAEAIYESWKSRTIKLSDPIPVVIEYARASVGADGTVRYHPNPYGF